MDINVPILEKTKRNITKEIKVLSSKDVANLKQVQAIRNAVKEHLLFIGVDRGNNVRNISILGIGSSCEVLIDSKDIIRTALLSCSEKVILVHNHPSNNLEPSSADIHITNITNNLLKTFNIELLDHIIVTEKEYISMEKIKKFNKEFTNDSIEKMTKGFLIEENKKLKNEIQELREKVKKNLIQEEYEVKIKPIRNNMENLKNKFKEITENDSNLEKYFKDDKHYTNIVVAGVILAGIAVRNSQRENGNLSGELEYSPFSKEQEKMIDEYTKFEKMLESIEQEIESNYEEKEEIEIDF